MLIDFADLDRVNYQKIEEQFWNNKSIYNMLLPKNTIVLPPISDKEYWLTPKTYWDIFKEYEIGKYVYSKFLVKHKELVERFIEELKKPD